MIDRTSFRDGMSRLAAAVTIVTTDAEAGRHGFTAYGVCSVIDIALGDDPEALVYFGRIYHNLKSVRGRKMIQYWFSACPRDA
ncbi:hypothetical protein ACI2J4_23995 [Agrobacterium tumefaciens]|uniref:hypothetical protein n=1 Tax=Agrobacterium tumefaciens TaxID=358 RepID=UPI00384E33B4